jgi:hypothetical protein
MGNDIRFSVDTFFVIIIMMNVVAFVGIIFSLSNNPNITPVSIISTVYSAFILFVIFQFILFLLPVTINFLFRLTRKIFVKEIVADSYD